MPDKPQITPQPGRDIFRRLSVRLVALLSLALLPIGLISIYQTQRVISESENLRQAALLLETNNAASSEREIIQQMAGAARGLATLSDLGTPERCTRLLSGFVAGNPHVVFAGYSQGPGRTACGSSARIQSFMAPDRVERAIASGDSGVEVLPGGAITKQPLIFINQPAERVNDTPALISIAIPVRLAVVEPAEAGFSGDLKIATVDAQGGVISASGGVANAARFLPANVALDLFPALAGKTFRAADAEGTERMYAVAEIVKDRVTAVGSWPVQSEAVGLTPTQRRIALVFPVLMWIAGVAVAYFGLQRQVIRHMKALGSAMRQFALGVRSEEGLQLDRPPEDFAELQRAFNRMALILSQAEAQQKADLRDKEVLLKEVHHRVKNNLQLIASIMNMQSRGASSPEAKKLLADVQRRVNGLAVMHRTLYTRPESSSVDARSLIHAVIDDISRMPLAKEITVESKLDEVQLFPDQAVPLSMFLNEALTNAVQYAGAPEGERPEIKVTLREHLDGHIDLNIRNTKPPAEAGDGSPPEPGMRNGLGTRLMAAYVHQLEGKQVVSEDDEKKSVSLIFEQLNFEPTTRKEPVAV